MWRFFFPFSSSQPVSVSVLWTSGRVSVFRIEHFLVPPSSEGPCEVKRGSSGPAPESCSSIFQAQGPESEWMVKGSWMESRHHGGQHPSWRCWACWLVGWKPVHDRKVFTCNRKVTEALEQISTGSEQVTCNIPSNKGHLPIHPTNPEVGSFWSELSIRILWEASWTWRILCPT